MKVKDIILHLISTCCIAAGVSACVTNEMIVPEVEDKSIWYNPAPVRTRPQTKVIEEFPTTSTFGSYAYMVPEGKTFDANKGDVVTFINNEKVSFQSTVWRGSQTYYWPHYGSLTFISYSPYELSTRESEFDFDCDKSYGISLTGFSLPNTIGYSDSKDDILITDIVKDLKGSSAYYTSGVPTIFKHRLCKVAVKASINNVLDNAGDYIKITGITLKHIYTKGNYTLVGGWKTQSELKTYSNTPLDVSLALDPVSVFDGTLMIPQTTTVSDRGIGNEPTLVVNYTTYIAGVKDEKEATLKLYSGPGSLAAWEEGKLITYYLSISTKDEFIEFSGSYNAWVDDGNNDINMGL